MKLNSMRNNIDIVVSLIELVESVIENIFIIKLKKNKIKLEI